MVIKRAPRLGDDARTMASTTYDLGVFLWLAEGEILGMSRLKCDWLPAPRTSNRNKPGL